MSKQNNDSVVSTVNNPLSRQVEIDRLTGVSDKLMKSNTGKRAGVCSMFGQQNINTTACNTACVADFPKRFRSCTQYLQVLADIDTLKNRRVVRTGNGFTNYGGQEFLTEKIEAGVFNRSQIISMFVAQFTGQKSSDASLTGTARTGCTDCLNPKYSRFQKLAVCEDNVFRFLDVPVSDVQVKYGQMKPVDTINGVLKKHGFVCSVRTMSNGKEKVTIKKIQK